MTYDILTTLMVRSMFWINDEMVYEMNHMNCGYEIKWSYDLRSYERNFYNCVEKPEICQLKVEVLNFSGFSTQL